MDWENERYVRLYTRDTADLLAVGWEGRLVWYELLRHVDRAGVIDTGGDIAVVAEMIRVPIDVWEVGFPRLENRGCVEVGERALVLPNFLLAQEAKSSDKQRARESRARRRANVTKRDAQVTPRDENVTDRDASVTTGHTVSHAVTPCHSTLRYATPNHATPNQNTHMVKPGEPGSPERASEDGSGKQKKKPRGRAPVDSLSSSERSTVETLFDRFSEWTGVKYELERGGVITANTQIIVSRLRAGYTETDLRAVVYHKGNEWSDVPEMRKNIRPKTLFGVDNLEGYLPEAKAWKEKMNGGETSRDEGTDERDHVRRMRGSDSDNLSAGALQAVLHRTPEPTDRDDPEGV